MSRVQTPSVTPSISLGFSVADGVREIRCSRVCRPEHGCMRAPSEDGFAAWRGPYLFVAVSCSRPSRNHSRSTVFRAHGHSLEDPLGDHPLDSGNAPGSLFAQTTALVAIFAAACSGQTAPGIAGTSGAGRDAGSSDADASDCCEPIVDTGARFDRRCGESTPPSADASVLPVGARSCTGRPALPVRSRFTPCRGCRRLHVGPAVYGWNERSLLSF